MRVVGVAVLSVDGCLTRHDEPGAPFASPEDQALFRATMRECRAVVMGRRTFDVARERILAPSALPVLRTIMTREPSRYASAVRPGSVEFTDASPRALVESLAARGYDALAVLGGRQIYDLFTADDLLTEWQITVEPRLFGSGTRLLACATDRRLRLVEHRLLNESTILLRYRLARP